MQPPRVHWATVDQTTCEAMLKVLIKRIHPTVQAIDGSGGDGGIDLLMHTENGLVVYQIKSFTERLAGNRRVKVARSLERASQHGPVEWHLVVPIDPTPGELEWFAELTEPYPFTCVWDSKTWVDSEMAQRPDIADYYLHGSEKRILAMLREIGAEHPALDHGVAAASMARVGEIVGRLNTLDPHYKFRVTVEPDGTVGWAAFPRYPGAGRDRPAATARLAFPDTPEGAHARGMVEELFDYGTPCVLPPEYVAGVSVHVPVGLERTFTGGALALSASVPEPPQSVEAALQAVDAQGAILAQLPLEETERTVGHRGVRLLLRDKSAALAVQARFDASDGSGEMTVRYDHPHEFSPLDLLPAAKFGEAITRADHLALVVNGEVLGRGTYDVDALFSEGDAEYVRFTEHLAHLQAATGVFFPIRGEVTAEDTRDVVLASRLLRGERITQTWTEFAMTITPEGRGPVAAALQDGAEAAGTPATTIRSGAHLSIVVQGTTVPIGMLVKEVDSAKVLSWTEAGDGAPPGASTLVLVPAETNTLTMFLDDRTPL